MTRLLLYLSVLLFSCQIFAAAAVDGVENSSKPAINLDLDEDHNSGAIINGADSDSEENFILSAGSSAIRNSLSTVAPSLLYLSPKNTKPKQHHIRSPPTLL